jgi:hypothetical protein
MTERDAGFAFHFACPCRDRFEVVDDKVVLFNREFAYVRYKLRHSQLTGRVYNVYTAFFAEYEAHAIPLVGDRKWYIHIGLYAAHQYVNVAVASQFGVYVPGTA